MNNWPLQSDAISFYGDPRTGLFEAGLVLVKCPWVLRYEGKPVRGIRIHHKCVASLSRVLAATWTAIERSQEVADDMGISSYNGSYNFRVIRGGKRLSMHAFGCAIDFDAEHNPQHGKGRFTHSNPLVKSFLDENWVWGGDWANATDPMHFQAARVG